MKLSLELQKLIDKGYADKLSDYLQFSNFERIQIGGYLIFIYHPSKDEYVAQLIQNNDIIDSEEYSSHYPAFNKCLEYMKDALDASGYTSLEDCEQHPNSLQYAIEKHTYLESIAPLIYFKQLDADSYVLLIRVKESNWIEHWGYDKISKELKIDIRSKECIRLIPETLTDFTYLCGVPEEGLGYKLIGYGSIDTDKFINDISNLVIPHTLNAYLNSLLNVFDLVSCEIENITQGWKNTSKFASIKEEIEKIDNLKYEDWI